MAKYIVLINWTDQGVRSAKETVKRSKVFREAAQAMDAKVTDVCWTIGPYDIVSTIEAPNDEVITRLGLMLAAQGNARSTTMRAFGESDMERIIQGLP